MIWQRVLTAAIVKLSIQGRLWRHWSTRRCWSRRTYAKFSKTSVIYPCTFWWKIFSLFHCASYSPQLNDENRVDRQSMLLIMTLRVQEPELKEFIEDSIDECYDFLDTGTRIGKKRIHALYTHPGWVGSNILMKLDSTTFPRWGP